MRAAVLVSTAILVFASALAVATHRRDHSTLPPPAGPSYTALAAPYAPPAQKGACGIVIDAKTLGVAHPVLPCGVKIYIEYKNKQVLTQVVDRGPFALTAALAGLLHIDGTQPITWRFAS